MSLLSLVVIVSTAYIPVKVKQKGVFIPQSLLPSFHLHIFSVILLQRRKRCLNKKAKILGSLLFWSHQRRKSRFSSLASGVFWGHIGNYPNPIPALCFSSGYWWGLKNLPGQGREECRGSSQLTSSKNKVQGKGSIRNPKRQGEVTCSWRWHLHPVPGPLAIKHLVCALSFSQGQVLVLTLPLAFLPLFLSDFPLILFSFYLAFTDSQTPCHNAAAGSCY